MARKKPDWIDTPQRVEVLWEDHHLAATDEARPYLIQSIGYVVEQNDEVMKLAPSVGEDGTVWDDETITIIKKCVIRKMRHAAP